MWGLRSGSMAPLRDQKYTRFIGSSQVNVDQKGRISIPVRFRNLLLPEARDTLVLVQGLEQCVYGYPLDEWERLTNIFMSKSRSVEQSYRFNRRWALYTNTVTFDPQGRIPLPAHLRTFAKIENEAIVGGGVDHLEIWNPELLLQDI